MSTILDQKTVVCLLCLGAIVALVLVGKADASSAIDFIKVIVPAYLGASALEAGAQKIGIARLSQSAPPEAHAAAMRALGVKLPQQPRETEKKP